MQGKRSKVRNFPSQERKQKQKSLFTSKIRKRKKRQKNNGLAGRVGWGDKIARLGRATSRLVLEIIILINEYQ